MRYIIINDSTVSRLQERVNWAISTGFMPVGGVAATAVQIPYANERTGRDESETECRFIQAMVNPTLPPTREGAE